MNTNQLIKIYGAPGTNQTQITLPAPIRIAWDLKVTTTKITCHEKIADKVVLVLNDVLNHYGYEQYRSLKLDVFAGCLAVRKKRNGLRLSLHSFGIALDWASEQNRLRWNHTKALFAKPTYTKWFDLWEQHGFQSLGRLRDFDWMHVEIKH